MYCPSFIPVYALLGFITFQTGWCQTFSTPDDVVNSFPACSQTCARNAFTSVLNKCGLGSSSSAQSQLLCLCTGIDEQTGNDIANCVIQACDPSQVSLILTAVDGVAAFCKKLLTPSSSSTTSSKATVSTSTVSTSTVTTDKSTAKSASTTSSVISTNSTARSSSPITVVASKTTTAAAPATPTPFPGEATHSWASSSVLAVCMFAIFFAFM